MLDIWVKNFRYGLLASGMYCLVLSIVGGILVPPAMPPVAALEQPAARERVQKKLAFTLITGKPIRLVVPASGIDIPLDEGFYNTNDGTWTLSDTHAQYAMMSVVANNHSGNTFVYGHGTDQVFGRLNTAPPAAGSIASIYTAEGHVFEYLFQNSKSVTPTDTSALDYDGPPILTVQTCSGNFSEWRTMHRFTFLRVTMAN